MSEDKDVATAWAFAGIGVILGGVALILTLVAADREGALKSQLSILSAEVRTLKAAQCKPTPAPCCKADECRQELAKVDARFGGVWDELVEVQEQLAKLKPCGCGPVKECCCEPSKPCACSDKPACECKPQQKTQLPVHRVLKRCK